MSSGDGTRGSVRPRLLRETPDFLAVSQQMRWTQRGAHLLLQIRTKVLNGDLEDVFRRWYPQFRAAA